MKKLILAFLCLATAQISFAQRPLTISQGVEAQTSTSLQVSTVDLASMNSMSQKSQGANAITPLKIGTKVDLQAISLVDVVSDQTINFSELKMKNGTLVMFSCNTCPYVIKAQPRTKEMMALAKKNNIGFLIVNANEAQRLDVDSKDKMSEYATDQDYMYYFVDEESKIANQFGATKTPEVFLFNATDELVYTGAMDDNPGAPDEAKSFYLKDAMNALAAGKEIKTTTTKSVGCSIKRAKK